MTNRQRNAMLALGCGVAFAAAMRRRKTEYYHGRVVVITGGSRGLGLELARQWARLGARVALCARTSQDLRRAADELQGAGHEVLAIPCDVTQENQVASFIREILDRWGRIDVLVNNAGIIQAGPLGNMALDDFRETMDTHFFGPLYMIYEVLPHMRARRCGQIVNIASIGGEMSVPHLLPYSASKFALVGLSEGLHAELHREGITVTTVCPGLMRTGSPRNAEFKGNHVAEYAWFSISDSLPGVSIGARRAARQIVLAVRDRRAYLAVSLPAKVGIAVHGMFPGITARVLAFVNRLLPSPRGGTSVGHRGSQSFSRWSPSVLTILTERAAARNNEMR
ncbi:MAG TPA: SDR family oxidoreductase [Pirellulales bacterium]|jgi:NAD(P)-dependent dehydrogenase (short-subunit alcohol dehydrogenase family)|nr:SDR family oxidoreductase [Pirellulales bacterium]